MTATPSPTGVRVAPGDPGALLQAADWHAGLGDGLAAHAAMISDTAMSVSPAWQGEAAASYQSLSGLVADHFRSAASTSRTAAASLRRYATELQRLQQEGMQALQQAEHWLNEVNTWTTRLHTAQTAVQTADTAVRTAQSQLDGANAMGAKGVALATAALGRLGIAQASLRQAQDDLRRAQRELDDAQHQLTHWQRRGAELWHEAQDAAMKATGELEPLSIPEPPMAGTPAPGIGSLPYWMPHSSVDFALLGLGGWGAYKGKWAADTVDELRYQQRLTRSQIARERIIADNPDAPPAQRASAASELDRLGGDQRGISSAIGDATRWSNYADHFVGPAAGVLDTVSHIADGQGVAKSAAEGIGSTAGGYAGAAAGAGACDATGVLAPVSPICAGLGGAVGGWVGDKVGGVIGDLIG